MVLGEVEAGEPCLVGHLDQVEPILEQLVRRRAGDVLDVVEDAEGRRHAATLRLAFCAGPQPSMIAAARIGEP